VAQALGANLQRYSKRFRNVSDAVLAASYIRCGSFRFGRFHGFRLSRQDCGFGERIQISQLK
jgi:hypothetical protein